MATACRIDETPSRADQRRRRITDAARKLFIQNGFHATGMAQLAKESGIAIGQIYRDFASKEEIVAALVTADCGRLMMYEALDAAIATRDSDGVRRWLREYLDPGDERDGARLYAEIVAESGRNPRIASIFHELHDQRRVHLRAALALLAPDARPDRREVAAEALMALSIGLFQYSFTAPDRDVAPVLRAFHALLDQQLTWLAGD
jgi:AcrR family transcriptional regulator